jgi:hypothetical protein
MLSRPLGASRMGVHRADQTGCQPAERKGRRSFDAALEYAPVSRVANRGLRTTKPVVRATRFGSCWGFSAGHEVDKPQFWGEGGD